ncbi:GNAT family N-acetyltransferase [Fundidesulfovibrio terrae]|uniref:GNAT family N-acetyltransferase n=1 Tax=Fundidesulfovibrio terrae TaxID=2922866 RepID=UPI001FAF68C1
MKIVDATGGPALEEIRTLFREYSQGLGISLCFQGFEEELSGLPGRYAPPGGTILLALAEGDAPGAASDAETASDAGWRAAGCVAVRPLDEPGVCEMKRLYVRPDFRGMKLGRLLAEAAIEKARAAGYRAMRLDTLPSMASAIAMYEKLGFADIEPYCHNPHAGVRYMELAL